MLIDAIAQSTDLTTPDTHAHVENLYLQPDPCQLELELETGHYGPVGISVYSELVSFLNFTAGKEVEASTALAIRERIEAEGGIDFGDHML